MIIWDSNSHMEHVSASENLAFQDLLESFGSIKHVECPTYQLGHTLDLTITKEEETFSISDPVDEFYVSYHTLPYLCSFQCQYKQTTGSQKKKHKKQKMEVLMRMKLE